MVSQGILKLDSSLLSPLILCDNDGASLIIILNNTSTLLIPETKAKNIPYFQKQCISNGLRVCLINHPFNMKAFEKVIKLYDGRQCTFNRNQQVEHLFEVITFLGLENLKIQLLKDMITHFEEYNFYFLLELSRKRNMRQLYYKCLEQLVDENFEQFNFNRFELMESSKEAFKLMINLHEFFKEKELIQGLNMGSIKEIVNQYCKFNNLSLSVEDIIDEKENTREELVIFYEEKKNKVKNTWVKFRTPSFDITQLCESISFGQPKQDQDSQNNEALVLKKTSYTEEESQNFTSSIDIFDDKNEGQLPDLMMKQKSSKIAQDTAQSEKQNYFLASPLSAGKHIQMIQKNMNNILSNSDKRQNIHHRLILRTNSKT